MHPKTPSLAVELRRSPSMEQRFERLHDSFKDETAFLFSCGPSFKPEIVRDGGQLLKDRLVIAIKQTLPQLRGLADFHLYNPINHMKYDADPNTIRFLTHCPDKSKWKTFGPKPDLEADIDPLVPDVYSTREDWLICNHRFQDYLFTNQLFRPWGPGIVIESALYFALHLGVRRLICFGWDVSTGTNSKNPSPHFYDSIEQGQKVKVSRYKQILGVLRRNVPKKLALKIRHLQNYIEYQRGNRYNTPKALPNEFEAIWEGSYALYEFFKNSGMEIIIASDCSRLDPRIPRTSIEELSKLQDSR